MIPQAGPGEIFDVAGFLKKSDPRGRFEKVVERGEECGLMYIATRDTMSRKTVVIEFEAKGMTLSARLIAKDEKLEIADFGFNASMLRFEFVKRLVWLIFSEAKIRHKKIIAGKVAAASVHPILVECFRRYGFAVSENDDHDFDFYFAF